MVLKKGGGDTRYSLPLDNEVNTDNRIQNQSKKNNEPMRSMAVTQVDDNYAID
jgi:hypothetical protein